MNENNKQTIKRKFQGTVTSDTMDKTIVVAIVLKKRHPVYGKQFAVTKKYKVHDEKNEYKIGDRVTFVETRPISKDKRWKVLGKVSSKV